VVFVASPLSMQH